SAYGLNGTDAVLQKTPYSFDVSVWEFFWPILYGARLVVLRPGSHRDPKHLVDAIRRHAITTIHFVPSMLKAFLDQPGADTCTGLRRVVCSGEALPRKLQGQFHRRLLTTEMQNLYGLTEAAIDVTSWRCRPEDSDTPPPIGHPIWNIRMYVVDRALNPVPTGVAGDLYIAGVGLA